MASVASVAPVAEAAEAPVEEKASSSLEKEPEEREEAALVEKGTLIRWTLHPAMVTIMEK